ncbi:hypothetical protein [Pseudomonas sp. FME51]|uniref:hypothetical protein n=1 Tax=Pseudomonas sp. FME51 TaxID=2742609 RepID=UPI001867DEAB|nr:hypothetical protein [Pseudomonas sp. FME51]
MTVWAVSQPVRGMLLEQAALEQAARTLQQLSSHLWCINHPAAWEVENAAQPAGKQ